MGETTYTHGNSYGPEEAAVQFAVDVVAGPVGTFFRGAKRINRVRFRNIGDNSVNLKIQENDNLGSSGWTDVGSAVDVVGGGGEKEIDVSGLISKPYARIYGVATGGTSIVRAQVTDLDLIDHFRQNKPYGVG